MKKISSLILVLLSFTGFAQAQISLSGSVRNEKGEAIPFATVTVTKAEESALLHYTITNDKGEYAFRGLDKISYNVETRFMGYVSQKQSIDLTGRTKNEILDFVLKADVKNLDGVEIVGQYSGIVFKEDTIIYDPEVFKDGTEVVLGDVLSKLPGIEVSPSGSVKSQGKDVDKILVNGQDFYGGNVQMATKNLPADIAESVEVLNNYSEYSLLNGFTTKEQTAINIGVNKSKLGRVSGNLYGGYAVKDKYTAKADLMRLGSKSMLSLLGSVNNTGEAVFSIEDYIRLQGGINSFFGAGGSINLSEDESRLLLPMSNTYKQTQGLSAINFSYQPSPKFKMNTYALYNAGRTESEDLNIYTYNPDLSSAYTVTENKYSLVDNKLLSGFVKMDYNPSETLSLVYKGSLSSSGIYKENKVANRNFLTDLSSFEKVKTPALRTNHELMMMKAVGKNVWLLYGKMNYNNSPMTLDLQTDSLLLPIGLPVSDEWYYARQYRRENGFSGDLSSTFMYRLNKNYFLRSAIGLDYVDKSYYSDISTLIPNASWQVLGDSLSNDLSYQKTNAYVQLDFIKNKGKFQFKLGGALQFYTFNGSVMDKEKQDKKYRFNPNLKVSYAFSKSNEISLLYSRSLADNALSSFAENPVFNSYNSYRLGNISDYLINSKNQLTLRYNFYDMFSNTMINLYGSYTTMENRVAYNYTQQGPLSTYGSINSKDLEQFSASLYLDKGLGFIPWFLKLSASYSNFMNYNQLFGLDNEVDVERTTAQLSLESRMAFPLNFEVISRWDYSENKFQERANASQFQQTYGGKIKFKKGAFYSDIELNYVKNDWQEDYEELVVLNAEIQYDLSKKISVFAKGTNILNIEQHSWTTLSYANNYILEKHFRQIPGYILLGVRAKF